MRTLLKIATVFLVLALLRQASAAAECVAPGGRGGCFELIQDAIDAAPAGGTVVVKPGRYRETFVVDKPLLLRGGGKGPAAVIIDGMNTIGATVGISATDVRLHNLTVWNSGSTGIEITPSGTNAAVSRVVVSGSNSMCIDSSASGTRIVGSRVLHCSSGGVRVDGDAFVMRNSTVTSARSGCVVATSNNAVVADSRFLNCGWGVDIAGGGARVTGSVVRYADFEGIRVIGPDAAIRGNVVQGTGLSSGIEVTSQRPVVTRNKVTNSGGASVHVTCSAACEGGEVSGNRVFSSRNAGFELFFSGAPALVEGNVAREVAEGFFLDGTGPYEIRGNVVQGSVWNGYYFESAVSSSVVEENVAENCALQGFDVGGANNTFKSNLVRTARIGFRINNVATGTVLSNNRAIGSSYKACDNGTGTTGAGNNFTLPAAACP